MAMSFHLSTTATILFDSWTVKTPFAFLLSCLVVFGAAVGYEWLAQYRRQLDREVAKQNKPAKDPKGGPTVVSDDMQWKRSAAYGASMTISYLLSGFLVL